jgi:hypothetical protein
MISVKVREMMTISISGSSDVNFFGIGLKLVNLIVLNPEKINLCVDYKNLPC